MFSQSRLRLTILYSSLMFCLFTLIIFMAQRSMEWAVTSEQARELSAVVQEVSETESALFQNNYFPDDLGTRERMFFYAYDNSGKLKNYSKAPERIENDVVQVIKSNQVPFNDVAIFEQHLDPEKPKVLMMTAADVTIDGHTVGAVYLGKDITALYKGIKKSIYLMGIISLVVLIAAAAVGYAISGKAMAPKQRAYEKQRQFAADASHELRTPLSVLMASADLLGNDASIQSPFLKQVIDDMKDEVKKMSKLVGDLLTIARSDNLTEKIKFQEIDLSSIVQQVVRNMQFMAEKKHLVLEDKVAEAIICIADEQKIKQLILIFIDNAIKYTPEGGTIHVSLLEGNNNKVKFVVQDTGIGIEKEDYDKIFGRFYRVDKARSREMGGNGLGLAIAKDIVAVHHGQIYVESVLGEGTTFTVELPKNQ